MTMLEFADMTVHVTRPARHYVEIEITDFGPLTLSIQLTPDQARKVGALLVGVADEPDEEPK